MLALSDLCVRLSNVFAPLDAVQQDDHLSHVHQAGLPSGLQCHHLGQTGEGWSRAGRFCAYIHVYAL